MGASSEEWAATSRDLTVGALAHGHGTQDASLRSALAAGRQALHVDGSLTESRRCFGAAFDLAVQVGDVDGMVESAVGLGGLWVHEHRGNSALGSVLRRQREALVVGAQAPGALELRLRLAAEEDYRRGRHQTILPMIGEARDEGRVEVLAAALSLAHHCLLGPDHGEIRRTLAEEMLLTATGSPRPSDLAMALLWRAVDRFLAGDPHAERDLTELAAHLQHEPNRAVGYAVRAMTVMLAIRRGELAKALTLADECHQEGLASGDVDAAGWFAAHQVAIHWFAGTLGDIGPWLADRVNSPDLSEVDSSVHAALAVAAAGAGNHHVASVALKQLGGGDLGSLPRSSTWLVSLYGAVEAAHLLGEREVAQEAYHLLLPYRTLPIMVSLAMACFGSVEQALGVAALTLDGPDRAVAHLTQAIRHNLALGHVPAMIFSRVRLAEALTARGAPGDAERAEDELARAALARRALGIADPPADDPKASAASARRQAARVRVGTAEPPVRGGDVASMKAVGRSRHAPHVVLRRRGRDWRVEMDGRTVVVRHSIGMLYLEQLLANPNREISAAELVAGQFGRRSIRADATTDAARITDEQALRQYRIRLKEVTRRIADDRTVGGDATVRELVEERDWLTREIAGTTGPGGRSRQFATNAERARISVGKAIRRAVERIEETDRQAGRWLRASVQTGKFCCYRPVPMATTG